MNPHTHGDPDATLALEMHIERMAHWASSSHRAPLFEVKLAGQRGGIH